MMSALKLILALKQHATSVRTLLAGGLVARWVVTSERVAWVSGQEFGWAFGWAFGRSHRHRSRRCLWPPIKRDHACVSDVNCVKEVNSAEFQFCRFQIV